MGDRKIDVVSVPRALCQPFVVLAGEVRRLIFVHHFNFWMNLPFFLSSTPTTQSKNQLKWPIFCWLSDGNHAKPLRLAWCLPETINRTVWLKLSPGLLKPQPRVVRQSLKLGRCFGECWLSIRKSKLCRVTCLVWVVTAEVLYICIYH